MINAEARGRDVLKQLYRLHRPTCSVCALQLSREHAVGLEAVCHAGLEKDLSKVLKKNVSSSRMS